MTNRQAKYIGQSIQGLEIIGYLAIAAFTPAGSIYGFFAGILFGLCLIASFLGHGSWKETTEE